MTSSLSRDLIFLILQFLDEEKFKETVHILQQESGIFFSMKYFEDLILGGKWEEVERYLSGFTRVDDNRYSMKIFFEIRKQKYLEALDKLDRAKAVDILTKDLKVFSSFNEDLFKEITQLLTLDNFRENEQLSTYRDAKTARTIMLIELKKLIEANPLLRDKLQFPNIKNSRLRMLINQSLNWQHSLCANPRQNPDIRTLMVDHSCRNSTDPYTQLASSNQLIVSAQKAEGFIPMCPNGPFQPASTSVPNPLNAWVTTPSSMSHPVVSVGGVGLGGPSNPAAASKGLGDSDSMSKARVCAVPDRIMLPGMNPSQNGLQFNMTEELPKTVARTLNQGSVPTSMDFHPIQQTLLLAGTSIGEISLWEVSSREKLVSRNFQVWDIGASSMALKAALIKDPSVSVRRILWSPDGSLFGVAYSKHMVQLYTYFGGNDIRQQLEIDSHIGAVNDLAFCNPSKQLSVITCGDDKTIRVWDVATGVKIYTFEGHEAAVHSVCPHYKEHVHFFFSTSVDGKIKAWLYDMMGSRVDYYAPGHSCATMAYSADGKRLFSCGTTKEGESHMVEWNENEGTVKRTYQGFDKRSLGVVQFDTAKNRFLAAGDDYMIKFWDMENSLLLMTVDAEGGLPASPRIRFNKEGSLLAVSANDNKIKILATVDGLRLMHTYLSPPCALGLQHVFFTQPYLTIYLPAMATTTEKPVATTAVPIASAANSLAEAKPKKTVDPASSSTYKSDPSSAVTLSDAEVSVKESEGSKTTGTAVGSVAGESSGPVNDIHKKIRRAERFGVPFQLSEREKRNSRAERFGTAPSSNGSEASKQSEELKRKARAERFGIVASSTATDEDAKKKARLARFAPYSKPDSVEEEKRRVRAVRFSNPSSSSLAQVNGKGNIEPEAPIVGKAGGRL